MKCILKLDSSTQTIKVDLITKSWAYSASQVNQFGSQVVLILINQVLNQAQLKLMDITEIEVSIGPGSFTGLKVGASIAQALSYSLNVPINGQIGKALEISYT